MGVWGNALLVGVVSVFWVVVPHLLAPTLPPVWGGTTRTDFKPVGDVFRKFLQDGRLKGGAVAAYYKGEIVVDLWGGYADLEAKRPWKKDTMTVVYSTTKLMGSVVIARMVDKGLLNYTEPVSRYWPEFGQNGKEKITVETLLSHRAGVPHLDNGILHTDLVDHLSDVEEKLAKQAPYFSPGSSFSYHALTWGLYVDTLARKVDPKHRNMSQIFQEDIAVPFGIDFYIGVPKQEHHRMARVYSMSLMHFLGQFLRDPDLYDLKRLYYMNPLWGSDPSKRIMAVTDFASAEGYVNDPDKAAIGLTSFFGQGTARGIAKVASILANGGTYKGKQLLSPEQISKLSESLGHWFDDLVQTDLPVGRGVGIFTSPQGKSMFGHAGFGGQIAVVDPHTGIGFAYCSNHLSKYGVGNDPIMLELQAAVYDVLRGDNS